MAFLICGITALLAFGHLCINSTNRTCTPLLKFFFSLVADSIIFLEWFKNWETIISRYLSWWFWVVSKTRLIKHLKGESYFSYWKDFVTYQINQAVLEGLWDSSLSAVLVRILLLLIFVWPLSGDCSEWNHDDSNSWTRPELKTTLWVEIHMVAYGWLSYSCLLLLQMVFLLVFFPAYFSLIDALVFNSESSNISTDLVILIFVVSPYGCNIFDMVTRFSFFFQFQ